MTVEPRTEPDAGALCRKSHCRGLMVAPREPARCKLAAEVLLAGRIVGPAGP